MHLIVESYIAGVGNRAVVKTAVCTLSEFRAAVLAAPNGAVLSHRKDRFGENTLMADFFVRDGKVYVVAGNRRFDYLLRIARIPRLTWEEFHS